MFIFSQHFWGKNHQQLKHVSLAGWHCWLSAGVLTETLVYAAVCATAGPYIRMTVIRQQS